MSIQRNVTSCDTSYLPTDGAFWQEPEDVLEIKQCSKMCFGWTKSFELPAWVYSFIANGDTFRTPITNSHSDSMLSWSCNIRAGTEVVFAVFTSGKYGNLAFLPPIKVGESEDDACLKGGRYGVSMLGEGGGSSWAPVDSPSGVSTETIVGAVVGSVLGAAAVIAIVA